MNVVIVHGANDSEESAFEGGRENTRHWHPWIKKKLEDKGISVSSDLYPKDWNPDYNEWKNVFEKNKIDDETILIGHSAGCAFILRWLSENEVKVRKVILVAPYVLDISQAPFLRSLVTFYLKEDINFFKELVIFYSLDDEEFILGSVNFIHEKIGGRLVEFKDKGHFTKDDMGKEEFPELLKEVLDNEN